MNVIKNIQQEEWPTLTKRPVFENATLTETVSTILKNVKAQKDQALKKYAIQFDNVVLDQFLVSLEEIDQAVAVVSKELKTAIQQAKSNIEKFHTSQQTNEKIIETTPGVKCWRKNVAIEKIGLYIPGGTAPLFSTVLMLGIPAKIAGCQEMVMCTPCNSAGKINPAILYTAQLVGIKKIFKVGGAQAIAAMAYGTESIPQVYKIFGPGNQYVTKAKELLQQNGIAIDMPAGPSELLVIADKTGVPEFIAADLLSQAEHGADSQVVLVSNDEQILKKTIAVLHTQVENLPRKDIAKKALQHSKAILLSTMEACLEFSNCYAPEHLIIASEKAVDYADLVVNAGSVFLGNYSCESAGDYASGTNHTLPTNGYAKNYSGVSLDSFVKKITFQQLSPQGISNIGKTIETMAAAEQLWAHKNAVTIRLKTINNV